MQKIWGSTPGISSKKNELQIIGKTSDWDPGETLPVRVDSVGLDGQIFDQIYEEPDENFKFHHQ